MASIVDQRSEFEYFCKICNKRFGCGRALSGHMRSHGIGDESRYIDDGDTTGAWEDKLGGNIVSPSNKSMYGLRTNPNQLKGCRDSESLGSSQGSDGDNDGETRRGAGNLFKRKRSMVSDGPSSEEEDVANCLMMLSNATGVVPFITKPEESCTSASKEEERRNTMNFVTPIACRPMDKAKGVAKGLFECKACNKVFNSHQALGGHRASHKKVKGCFAARLDNDHNHRDDSSANNDRDLDHDVVFLAKSIPTFRVDTLASASKKKPKVHECSICHRVFSSGQALGGHKRCHWIASNPPAGHSSSLVKSHRLQNNVNQIQQTQRSRFVGDSEPLDLQLDLNLPASTIELMQLQVDNNNNDTIKNNICNSSKQDEEDKTGSTMMLAKLSELKDINMSGSSFPWLQVGIVSTTNVGSDPYIL
ncbi:hypothetical protein HRI_003498100 [Hibiscus trionum]|uniref:C2H2-type domain-containing protein n=1 Tax=Hibiscus trionum TaxID=183268 RepID=A0A9W7IQJ0_HIBTR|nr:hypothetical protein HRI_003498100 [Hibiscus trionum]